MAFIFGCSSDYGGGTPAISSSSLETAVSSSSAESSSSSTPPGSSSLATYIVTYNANNGTGAPAAQTKTHDVLLTLSYDKPTRTGYAFTGWNNNYKGQLFSVRCLQD